jgi:membrane protein
MHENKGQGIRARVTGSLRRLWQRVATSIPGRFVARVYRFGMNVDMRFRYSGSAMMGGAIALYAIVCLTPLGILAVMVLQYVVGGEDGTAYDELKKALLYQVAPEQATQIMDDISKILASPNPAVTGGLSVVGLLWGATRLFDALVRALNTVWPDARYRGFFLRNLIGFLTLVAAGIGLTGYMVVVSVLASVRPWLKSVGVPLGETILRHALPVPLLAVVFAFICFFLIYKLIPARQVANRAAIVGAAVATVGWQLGQVLFAWIMSFSTPSTSVYGSLTSVVVFALWMHVLASLTLIGAHVAAEIEGAPMPRRFDGIEPPDDEEPDDEAVQC